MPISEISDINGGAYDAPSDKDFIADHLFGADSVDLPDKVDLNVVPSQNQGNSWRCTAFSITHCELILNTLEFNLKACADANEQWANQIYERGAAYAAIMEKEGDSLQNALNALLKYGLNNKNPEIKVDKFMITGYARIGNDIDSIMKYLAKGYPIYTGSGNHCYCLVGYDKQNKILIAKNSYGEKWGKRGDGTFTIDFADIGRLFSKYILFDKKDLKMIFKDVSEQSPMATAIKWCLDKGYMKGYGISADPIERLFMPDKPITRAELAQVLYNVMNNAK